MKFSLTGTPKGTDNTVTLILLEEIPIDMYGEQILKSLDVAVQSERHFIFRNKAGNCCWVNTRDYSVLTCSLIQVNSND